MYKLEKNVRSRLKRKEILLVSHVVLGFPSFQLGRESVDEMVKAGTDIIELQIPFSDPEADGPFFTMAQQASLDLGARVSECFDFARDVCARHKSTNFVFMTYYNILFRYGVRRFVKDAADAGVQGIIVPDLPIEEAGDYVESCRQFDVAPIFMFTPTSSDDRMSEIARSAGGFVYCQARVGITGVKTEFGYEKERYINRCRAATDLPLAMGFGIQEKADVDFLKGKVDIAICCTQAVKVLAKDGAEAMGEFLRKLNV